MKNNIRMLFLQVSMLSPGLLVLGACAPDPVVGGSRDGDWPAP